MRRIIISCILCLFIFSSICSADVYTTKISDLGAENFIQQYNSATLKQHGEMNYFVTPELSTPKMWEGFWPYDLWKTISIDSKYQLELTVDKKGYVTKIEMNYQYKSDMKSALELMARMLQIGSIMTDSQIGYLYQNAKEGRDKREVV